MNSREEILHLLAPLTSILRMPDDLIGILAVARRLVPVLRSLVRVTDEKQQPLISACLAGLEQVIDGASCVAQFFPEALGLTLTPPSNTSRRKARSTRRPARHRKRPCIYAGVGLSRAGGWPAAA